MKRVFTIIVAVATALLLTMGVFAGSDSYSGTVNTGLGTYSVSDYLYVSSTSTTASMSFSLSSGTGSITPQTIIDGTVYSVDAIIGSLYSNTNNGSTASASASYANHSDVHANCSFSLEGRGVFLNANA